MSSSSVPAPSMGARLAQYATRFTRRRQREADLVADRERRRQCRTVMQRFLRAHGQSGGGIMNRQEFERVVAKGIGAADLSQMLAERLRSAAGLVIGHRYVGRRREPVFMDAAQRLRHTISIGRSGAGKTTGLRHAVLSDAVAGNGFGVIALEAELIRDEILPFLPASRWDDVVVVDPADLQRPVPLNPLDLRPGEDLDLKASRLNTTFKRLCAEEGATGAPRMELMFAMASYALLPIPGTTLLDFERLVDRHDPTFRRWVVAQTSDERTRHFWSTTFESYPKDAPLSLVNRLGRLLRPKVVRNLLCQPSGSFDIRSAMDEGKIVLVQLPDGLLGEDTAALLAQLFAAEWQLGAMSRADTAAFERREFYLYLDEAQRTAGVAESSFEQLFSRSRKYGLGLNLAFQHFGQMPESLVRDMLGTVGSIISYQVGATDARRLSREIVGESDGRIVGVDPDLLVSLPVGQAICRIGRRVLRLHVPPPPTGGSEKTRDEILRRSRERYGITPVAPEQAGPVSIVVDDSGSAL